MTTAGDFDAANALRSARRAAGSTQAQLATRSVTSQAAISEIERGRRQPSAELLDRLLRACESQLTVIGGQPMRVDPHDLVHLREQAQRRPAERLARFRQLFRLKGLAVPPADPPAVITANFERVDMRVVQLDPEALLAALAVGGVDFVVVGGIAAMLRGDIVTTEDTDVAVGDTPQNLAALADVLTTVGGRLLVSINDLEHATLDAAVTPQMFAALVGCRFLTAHGVLDVKLWRVDTTSYDSWAPRATTVSLTSGTRVRVAALEDLITSTAEANEPRRGYTLARLHALREIHRAAEQDKDQ